MGGRAGRTGINVYRGREMGPVELEMGPEGPVCQKVLGGGGKNWFQCLGYQGVAWGTGGIKVECQVKSNGSSGRYLRGMAWMLTPTVWPEKGR